MTSKAACKHTAATAGLSASAKQGNVGESHHVTAPPLFYSPFAPGMELPPPSPPLHASISTSVLTPFTSCASSRASYLQFLQRPTRITTTFCNLFKWLKLKCSVLLTRLCVSVFSVNHDHAFSLTLEDLLVPPSPCISSCHHPTHHPHAL